MFQSRTLKTLVILLAILVLSGVAYAFAAANTVPSTYAGDGKGTISGYEVGNVVYGYSLDNTYITQIAFNTLDKNTHNPVPADTVKVQLSDNGAWFECAEAEGNATAWTCDLTTSGEFADGVLINDATQLRVVAYQ